ncbi:hypothetical protein KBC04_03095 [Candidatus Babeliales bacterium]|nr:hypothetical protein [Candidatus Babeliales bacterium]MBP9843963.1 hypothetical protein [Candidatus Babeliales bacterium]
MGNFLEEWLFGIDQERDIKLFLKKYPTVDIRQIIEKVEIFNRMVQNRDLETLEQFRLVVDENLKKNMRRAVVLARFLRKYLFRSIFPLNNYIDLLQDDTVKIYMKYKKRLYKERRYFSYYLIFKRVESDWVIVETNLLYKLQWREWIKIFLWFFVFLILLWDFAFNNMISK